MKNYKKTLGDLATLKEELEFANEMLKEAEENSDTSSINASKLTIADLKAQIKALESPNASTSQKTEKPNPKNTQKKVRQKKSTPKGGDACDEENSKLKKENAELKQMLDSGGITFRGQRAKTQNKSRNERINKVKSFQKTSENYKKRKKSKTNSNSAPSDAKIQSEKPKTSAEVKKDKIVIAQEAQKQVENNTQNTETPKEKAKRGRKPSLTPKQEKEKKDKTRIGEEVYAHNAIYNIARRLQALAKKDNDKERINTYMYATKSNKAGQWSKSNEGGSIISNIIEEMSRTENRAISISESELKALSDITKSSHIPVSVQKYKSYLSLVKNPNAEKAKLLAKQIKNSKSITPKSLMYKELQEILPELEKGKVPTPTLKGLGATKYENTMGMVSCLQGKRLIHKKVKK